MAADPRALTPVAAAGATVQDSLYSESVATSCAQNPAAATGSPETFGAMLRRFRLRTAGRANGNRFEPLRLSLSICSLARLVGVDQAYISRIERGKQQPRISREVVLSIADALDLSMSETDRFLFAAGLAPQSDYQALYQAALTRLATIAQALTGVPLAAQTVGEAVAL